MYRKVKHYKPIAHRAGYRLVTSKNLPTSYSFSDKIGLPIISVTETG